jgi:hypothetical protein
MPDIEYANAPRSITPPNRAGKLQTIADATGLPLARIRQLDAENRLHTLYDECGYLRPRRPMTGRQAVAATLAVRWPELRGQIDRLARQRLEFLLDRKLVFDLDPAEAAELAYLEYLDGTGPAVPAVPVKDGGCCDRSAPLSGRQAQLELLRQRWST